MMDVITGYDSDIGELIQGIIYGLILIGIVTAAGIAFLRWNGGIGWRGVRSVGWFLFWRRRR